MSGLKFVKDPSWPREYATDDGLVRIDYCVNLPESPWRVRDDRPPFPKPFDKSTSFHSTLADAKAWANAVVWPER